MAKIKTNEGSREGGGQETIDKTAVSFRVKLEPSLLD